jgi:hypothetical protein
LAKARSGAEKFAGDFDCMEKVLVQEAWWGQLLVLRCARRDNSKANFLLYFKCFVSMEKMQTKKSRDRSLQRAGRRWKETR